MKYPERNRHCPLSANCFDYHDRSCDQCVIGQTIYKLHRRIVRLEQKIKDLEEKKNDKDADKVN